MEILRREAALSRFETFEEDGVPIDADTID
jgi:hypothetical protein